MRSIIVKNKKIIFKLFTLFFISLVSGFLGYKLGLNFKQVLAICVFLFSIGGTLFFWNFRLSFAFLGTSILLISSTINLEDLIKSSSLEVILFLVGMMILIGLLKYSGFFAWLVMFVLRIKNLNSFKFFIYICVFSAILACAVDEVTSIIFMIAAILQICDFFEISPVPFIIISVLTTNIGSSGTVLGNPIGIIIATRAKLTFEDFILNAFPIMLACLVLTMFLLFFYYRSYLKEFNKKIKEFGKNEIFLKLISVPPDRNLRISLVIFLFSLFFIALHHRLELLLNLEVNTILLVVPLFFSAIVMVWKHKEARYFVETDVEWWTLLFFLFLFVQVGALKSTGVIDIFAEKISLLAGQKYYILNAVILW
ncbi:MAG: SLC13 family permease, partial [Candidatus Aenigmatarchaeota archaeon]